MDSQLALRDPEEDLDRIDIVSTSRDSRREPPHQARNIGTPLSITVASNGPVQHIEDVTVNLRIFQSFYGSLRSLFNSEEVSNRTGQAAIQALNNAILPVPAFLDTRALRNKKILWGCGAVLITSVCIMSLYFAIQKTFYKFFSASGDQDASSGKNEDLLFYGMESWQVVLFVCFVHTAVSVLKPLYQWVRVYFDQAAAEKQYIRYPDLLPFAPRIMNRGFWLAQLPTYPLDDNPLPLKRVIIIHTGTEDFDTSPENGLITRNIQMRHVEAKKFFDIGYNFLIGGDGCVYEGRGFDKAGAHTKGYNRGSLGIAFIGTYTHKSPRDNQLEALNKLLGFGVKLKKLSENYKLNVHCQFQVTDSPGKKLVRHLVNWDHFDSSLPILEHGDQEDEGNYQDALFQNDVIEN